MQGAAKMIKRLKPSRRSLAIATITVVLSTLALGNSLVLAQAESLQNYADAVGKPPADARASNIGEPRFGGVLQVAERSTIHALDAHIDTAREIIEVNLHIAEGLFALDRNGEPAPQLVDTYAISDDGTSYTFTLRRGVPFHDGNEVTTTDVTASLERWLKGPLGRQAEDVVEEIQSVDPYTFVITLSEPWPYLIFLMSVPQPNSAWIYPRDQVVEAGAEPIGMPIGTGPYRINRNADGQFIHLVRFEEYVGRPEPASGFAGGKVAYLDEIFLNFIADESVRVAGVQAGQYHVGKGVNTDLFTNLDRDDRLRTRIHAGPANVANFNKQAGPLVDQRIREAFALAIDIPTVVAANGLPQFNILEASLMPAGDPWHSDIGTETYLRFDPDRARELLAEAAYDGEPIRWIVDPSVSYQYTTALVAAPMLEAVGINVQLVPLDAASLRATRTESNRYEVFSTSYASKPEPTATTYLQASHPGWWEDDRKDELIAEMRSHRDFDTQMQLWEQLQEHFYEYVPLIKFQTLAELDLESATYSGFWRSNGYFYYVNTWLNE